MVLLKVSRPRKRGGVGGILALGARQGCLNGSPGGQKFGTVRYAQKAGTEDLVLSPLIIADW